MFKSIGIVTGQIISSSVGPTSGFRLPFVIVALPTLILAPIYRFTTREPVRGAKEDVVVAAVGENAGDGIYRGKMDFEKFKLIAKNRTVVLGYLQGLPGALPFAVLFTFFQDFLVNVVGGITVEQTASVVLSFGAGSVLGQVGAGFICDRLWKWRHESLPLYCALTSILGMLPMYELINGPSRPIGYYATCLFPIGIVLAQAGVGLGVVFLNVTLPETRGTASAIGTIFSDVGSAIGPLAVGGFVAASGGDERKGFSIAITFYFVAAFFMLCMCWTVHKDLERNVLLQKEILLQSGSISEEGLLDQLDQRSTLQSQLAASRKLEDELNLSPPKPIRVDVARKDQQYRSQSLALPPGYATSLNPTFEY